MSYDAFLELASSRVSQRKFLPDPVPAEDVRRMIECARHAPSGHNIQPWRFMPIADRSLIAGLAAVVSRRLEQARAGLPAVDARELERHSFFALHFAEAPLVIAVFSAQEAELAGAVSRHFGVPVGAELARDILMQSIGAAVQNLLLAAHALGYGACWMAAPVGLAGEELQFRLGIAAPARLAALVPVGRPTKRRSPAPKRSVKELVIEPDPGRPAANAEQPALGGGLLLRPYESGDEAALISLWERCGLVKPWNDPAKDIRRKLAVRPDLFLIGLLDSRLAAAVMAGYEGHRGWINYLAVDPELRRRGLGRALMAEAERRLRASGCPKINLQVRASNVRVIEFYKRIGFSVDEVVSLGKRLEDDMPRG